MCFCVTENLCIYFTDLYAGLLLAFSSAKLLYLGYANMRCCAMVSCPRQINEVYAVQLIVYFGILQGESLGLNIM